MNQESIINEKDIYKIFVFLLVTCGFLLIFLIPPMCVPDENVHFLNSYAASRGDFFAEANNNTVGKYFPQYVLDFVNANNGKYNGNFEDRYSFGDSYFQSWLEVNQESRQEVYYSSSLMSINPWAYIFSAIGMRMGIISLKILGSNFDTAYNILLAGRIGNFLAYCILGIIAVRVTPVLKKTMMFLLLMPMSIFLGASLSYDAVVIPSSMLFFAVLIRLMNEDVKKVEIRDMIIVSLCALILVSSKPIYAPFLLLLFFVPFSKFGTKRKYIICIICVVVSFLIGYLGPNIINRIVSRNCISEEIAEIAIQRQYFKSHVYIAPKLIINSLKEYSNFYLTGFCGKLGVLDTNYSMPFIVIILFNLIITTLLEASETLRIKWAFRLANVFLLFVSVSIMFVVTYITWTPKMMPPMGDLVSGVQGRYFIPIYLFGTIIIFNNLLKKIPERVVRMVRRYHDVLFSLFICIETISVPLIILVRYWG